MADDRTDAPSGGVGSAPPRKKKPYEPPRVLSDEAFEQVSLACSTNVKMTTKKNFT